jgi:hypothetical protein
VLHLGLRRQIPAEAHGYGSGRNLRQPGDYHDVRGLHGSREPRGEGERNREPVGHADHDVAHNLCRREMMFGVLHGRSRLTEWMSRRYAKQVDEAAASARGILMVLILFACLRGLMGEES